MNSIILNLVKSSTNNNFETYLWMSQNLRGRVFDRETATTITVAVSDLGNHGAGGAKEAVATIDVAVTKVNRSPKVTLSGGDSMTVDEDAKVPLSGRFAVGDDDNDAVTCELTTSHGALSLGWSLPSGVESVAGDYTAGAGILKIRGAPAKAEARGKCN